MTRENELPASSARADAANDVSNSLARVLGQLLDASGDCIAYENENFLEWLEREVQGRCSEAELLESGLAARQIAKRAQARIRAARVGDALPIQPLRPRTATVVGNASQVARMASGSRCAPWVESVAVAAGTGREIWDEPCERWVELPRDAASGDHLALTVSGDSMTPCLHSGDVILVSARKPVTLDSIVVARRAEDGYVVKHVTMCEKAKLQLSSFNREYTPFVIERSPGTIIGVVIAKLVREGDGKVS